VLVGIEIIAKHKCNKLFGYKDARVLTQDRRVVDIAFIGRDIWYDTFAYSYDDSTYYKLPPIEDGTEIDQDVTISEYDEPEIPFDGATATDPRVWLKATGPATIMAVVYGIESDSPSAPGG
jgi:hypothetical protein